MAQLIVTADKLNKRKSVPPNLSEPAGIAGIVNKGFTFEGTEADASEVPNTALGKWFKDRDGYFYWGGGVTATSLGVESTETNYSTYVQGYNFDWLSTNGIGVTIGLIDTGITTDKEYYNNFREEVISNVNRVLSHGNFIGGILCGKKSVNGLAKDSTIYSIKYKSDGEDLLTQLNNFIIALTKILNFNDSIIVNISQGFNFKTLNEQFPAQEQKILDLIQQISSQKNKLMICAADDNSAINDVLFPANLNECISIGSIDEFSKDIVINVKLDLLTPMVTFKSFDNSFNTVQDSGSSFSTSMISAFAADYLSKNERIDKATFLAELKKSSTDRTLFQYGDISTFQYQIIQVTS